MDDEARYAREHHWLPWALVALSVVLAAPLVFVGLLGLTHDPDEPSGALTGFDISVVVHSNPQLASSGTCIPDDPRMPVAPEVRVVDASDRVVLRAALPRNGSLLDDTGACEFRLRAVAPDVDTTYRLSVVGIAEDVSFDLATSAEQQSRDVRVRLVLSTQVA